MKTKTAITTAASCRPCPAVPAEETQYSRWLGQVRSRFQQVIAGSQPLFTTSAPLGRDLFDIYLMEIPAPRRQHYNCNACRRFINTYGGLVYIDVASGAQHSALWDIATAPNFFQPAAERLIRYVERAAVTGVFLTGTTVLGVPEDGPRGERFHHLSVVLPMSAHSFFSSKLLTVDQKMAEKREDHKMLTEAVTVFGANVVERAVALLQAEALYRGEKTLGIAKWFQAVFVSLCGKRTAAHSNMLWLAVALAPAGFCHIKSSMIGTLLEDLQAQLPIAEVQRKFAAKMNPQQYQRPQAAPAAGNIQQAEATVAKLGIQDSLRRRFATIRDVKLMWKPKKAAPVVTPTTGVFGRVQPRSQTQQTRTVQAPGLTAMSWARFARVVLPTAEKIEYYVKSVSGPYLGLLTATVRTAPPILQWDSLTQRNPVSWYIYIGDSSGVDWNLCEGWVPVRGITNSPAHWYEPDKFKNHAAFALLVLEGARDLRNPGMCLFPEILKSELHGVRATLEAYSRTGAPDTPATGRPVAGIQISDAVRAERVRVLAAGVTTEYMIDRFE